VSLQRVSENVITFWMPTHTRTWRNKECLVFDNKWGPYSTLKVSGKNIIGLCQKICLKIIACNPGTVVPR